MNMVRTTISLPEDLHEKWRMESLRKKISFSDLILEKVGAKKFSSIDDDFRLFDLVGKSGKNIDLLKTLRTERDRDGK